MIENVEFEKTKKNEKLYILCFSYYSLVVGIL